MGPIEDITPPYTPVGHETCLYSAETPISLLGDFLFVEHSYNSGSTDHDREVAVFTTDRLHCAETFTVQSAKLNIAKYTHETLNFELWYSIVYSCIILNGRVLLICRKCGNVSIPLTNELWPTPHAVLTVFRSHLAACSPHLYTVKHPRDLIGATSAHYEEINLILNCNLIAAARFQAPEVNGLNPQCYHTLSSGARYEPRNSA